MGWRPYIRAEVLIMVAQNDTDLAYQLTKSLEKERRMPAVSGTASLVWRKWSSYSPWNTKGHSYNLHRYEIFREKGVGGFRG